MKNGQFEKLRYLIALAEERNITRAAERLYISQPALTACLNRLEESLGVRLFDRSVMPIRLTTAGQYYISEMQKIEYQQNQILENMRRMNNELESTLRIGIGRNRGSIWLPQILEKVYERFPEARIEITEDRDENMTEKVVHNMLDVAIIETFFYIGQLSYLKLPNEPHCLITGYNNPYLTDDMDLSNNSPWTPLDVDVSFINDQKFICPSVRGLLNYYTQQLFTTFRITPKEIIFIHNNSTAYQLAVKGIGTTYLNVRYADIVKTAEKPLFIMPGGKPDFRKIYAVYKETGMTELNRYFIETAASVMQKELLVKEE